MMTGSLAIPTATTTSAVRIPAAACLAVAVAFTAPDVAYSQEATVADPAHYVVEYENEKIRVVRGYYGVGERSVMHEHPAVLAVFLTDGKARFRLQDGSIQEFSWTAGRTEWLPAGAHLPENVGSEPFELLLIEVKQGGSCQATCDP